VSRGRPEDPVFGFGPAARFAEELRELRRRTGGASYERMEREARRQGAGVGSSRASLNKAANGHDVPTFDVVSAYLLGCGLQDPTERATWLKRRAAAAEAQRTHADLSACLTMDDLRVALLNLIGSQGLGASPATVLAERVSQFADEAVGPWLLTKLRPQEIEDELHGPGPISEAVLTGVVFACGGLGDAVDHWQTARSRIADIPPQSPPRWYRRRAVLVGAAAGLGAAALAVVGYRWLPDERSRALARIPAITPSRSPARPTARGMLLDLERHVHRLPEAATTGRYAHTHLKVWSLETTPGDWLDPQTYDDEHLWWASDMSGLSIRTAIANGRPGAREVIEYAAGKLRVIPGPSDDPDKLRRQLARQPPELGPAGQLRAIADFYAFHPLTVAQRAAILRVLADTDGLEYDQTRPGPTGGDVSVSTTTGGSHSRVDRDRLFFNTATGALVGHEMLEVRRPDGTASGVATSYTQYVAQTRTDRLGA
jgi:hypothetical protein